MSTILSNAFTVDDLESMPDDGKRYELIGGAIVMTLPRSRYTSTSRARCSS